MRVLFSNPFSGRCASNFISLGSKELSEPFFSALLTMPFVLMNPGVFFIEFMTSFTMCFTFVNRRPPIASFNIYFLSHRLQMVRIYARWISTQMINHQSIWNWSIMQFVRKSVCSNSAMFHGWIENAIASRCGGTNPFPTCMKWNQHNFAPKSCIYVSHFTFINSVGWSVKCA